MSVFGKIKDPFKKVKPFKTTTQERVRGRVKEAQADGWDFLFIGAIQDAALLVDHKSINDVPHLAQHF